jgi:5S rRNA maturation endonuclease (ribonuclease M5)
MNKEKIKNPDLKNLLLEIEKSKNNLIIVEGKKDKTALIKLGFKKIFILNQNKKSIQEQTEEIEKILKKEKNKLLSILMDFDKKGQTLYKKLKQELSLQKLKIDDSLSNTIKSLKISHIEGLNSYIKNKIN